MDDGRPAVAADLFLARRRMLEANPKPRVEVISPSVYAYRSGCPYWSGKPSSTHVHRAGVCVG